MKTRFYLLFLANVLLLCSLSAKSSPTKDPGPLFPITKDGYWCWINREGNIIINSKLRWENGDTIGDFNDGLMEVVWGTKRGYMNKRGEIVFSYERDVGYGMEVSYPFNDGVATIVIDGNVGFIDTTGKVIIKPQYGFYDFLERFSEGSVPVTTTNGWAYINRQGEIIFKPQPQPDWAHTFHEGLAVVQIGYKYGYINKAGEYVVRPRYYTAMDFREGRAMVGPTLSGFFTYIDKNGRLITDRSFDDGEDFSDGLAAVCLGAKWGFIDLQGRFVIQPQFDNCGSFSEGLANVGLNGRVGYINKKRPLQIDLRAAKFLSPDLILLENEILAGRLRSDLSVIRVFLRSERTFLSSLSQLPPCLAPFQLHQALQVKRQGRHINLHANLG
jgi:hypothetical protein